MNKKAIVMTALAFVSALISVHLCHAGEIRLLFPRFELEAKVSSGITQYVASPLKGRGGKPVYVEKGLSQLVEEFKNKKYKVDMLELWIAGWEEYAGTTKLLISREGEHGFRIILKPSE